MGLSGDRVYNAVIKQDGTEILQWLKQNTPYYKPDDIKIWDQPLLSRKPEDQEHMARFLEIRENIAPQRRDISTRVDLIDFEEGRPIP